MQTLVNDSQLKYLIELCKAKNIPDEDILKILEENSKSNFLRDLSNSWNSSKDFALVPKKWQEYSIKYIEYMGCLMDPTKRYSTLPLEPNWPNPQVKKKTEAKFKRDLALFVLKEKNKALKVNDPEISEILLKTVTSGTNSVSGSPKLQNQDLIVPIEHVEESSSQKVEIAEKKDQESWSLENSDDEFTSKGPIIVEIKESEEIKKRVTEENLKNTSKKLKTLGERECRKDLIVEEKSKEIAQEKIEDHDLQSLREKVLKSRKSTKKVEDSQTVKVSEHTKSDTTSEEKENGNDEASLEEGEISSDAPEEKESFAKDSYEKDSRNNNNGRRSGDLRGRKYDNRPRRDDRRDRTVLPGTGVVQKHRAVVPNNAAMSSYLNYPGGGNVPQANNFIGGMPFFRPPIFAMGYNQSYPPNPYMQIDSNALAKAQMLANMTQQQSQPVFPQMSGTRSGGPTLNRPPMQQYTNSNQTNFWMMNMPHINNGPGFAFVPGNVPQNGAFYSGFAPRPNESSQTDPGYLYMDPTSRP